MPTITQREMRNDSGQILREAEQGQTLVITRHGTPVAQIGPITERSAYRAARRPAEFSPADLVWSETRTTEVLTDQRGER